jgi:hypothetical protein
MMICRVADGPWLWLRISASSCARLFVFGEDDHLRRRTNQVGEQIDETEAREREKESESHLSTGRTAGVTLVVTSAAQASK